MIPEGVSQVYLQKCGDSSLSKDLPTMVKYIQEQRSQLEVAMHSNATQFHKPEMSNAILEYVNFFTILSFGMNWGMPDYNCVSSGCDHVLSNVRIFNEVLLKPQRFVLRHLSSIHDNWRNLRNQPYCTNYIAVLVVTSQSL